MNRKKKLIFQLMGFIFIIGVIIVGTVTLLHKVSGTQIEGKYITKKDAVLLIRELIASEKEDASGDNTLLQQLSQLDEAGENYLTYGEFSAFLSQWEANDAGMEDYLSETVTKLKSRYKKKHYILQQDFLDIYFLLAQYVAPDMEWKQEDLILFAQGENVLDLQKNPIGQGKVLAASGDLTTMKILAYQREDSNVSRITAITNKEKIVLVLEETGAELTLRKAWISSNEADALTIIFKGYEITFFKQNFSYEERQVIGDVVFSDGVISSITPYNEKISGKLLSIKDNQMEIEGYGKIAYGEDIQVYKLYGEREDYTIENLKIGYDFTDFVLDEGVIVAALVTREENMENIRVVVKTTGFSSAYHDNIQFSVDTAFTLKGDGFEKRCQPGEKITVDVDSELFTANRIWIVPDALTAKTTVYSIERGQGTPAYRGTMEIEKTEQGLLLINEVLLEEYLYSVVPSEMPSSYPKEALKAQAVSARSYAYKHMEKSGLQSYGAHVDDSAAYQVYNNIAESEAAILAVRETKGQVVLLNGQVADTYFYSTSCGYGTDILAWKESSQEAEAHLTAKNIGTGGMASKETDDVVETASTENTDTGSDIPTAEDMKQEETFQAFIQSVGEGDFEKDEGWYRWSYVSNLDSDILLEQLKARYAAKPEQILTKTEDGSFVSKEIGKLGEVKNISVLKRSSGGAINELLIEGTKGTYKVISEHNVRYVLANEGNEVKRKTGDTSRISGMLPSAFAIVITEGEDTVESYCVIGGGFGHGIGMSQNGARAMGNLGYTYEEILKFFYEGITLSTL